MLLAVTARLARALDVQDAALNCNLSALGEEGEALSVEGGVEPVIQHSQWTLAVCCPSSYCTVALSQLVIQ